MRESRIQRLTVDKVRAYNCAVRQPEEVDRTARTIQRVRHSHEIPHGRRGSQVRHVLPAGVFETSLS